MGEHAAKHFRLRRRLLALVLIGGVPTCAPAAQGQVIRVGRYERLATIAAAANRVRDGDTVEIEARDYVNDVAVWEHNDITIRGVGGRPRLISGRSAEDKGTWVIRGRNVVVENIEFHDAIDSYGDGVGIRQTAGTLVVRDCAFLHNQMGLMTANHESLNLTVIRCEFARNRSDTRISHQLYVGRIGRFEVRDSYFHSGFKGHLLKSRARENFVFNNRLSDGVGGHASYELEFPNGGLAYVVGNLIEQSEETENSTMISFGAEHYWWPRNELYLVNNTLVDDLPHGGTFVRVYSGADRVMRMNNLLLGNGIVDVRGAKMMMSQDFHASAEEIPMAYSQDYRLSARSGLVGSAGDPGEANGVQLGQTREYVHPLQSRPLPERASNPGAFQTLAP